MNALQSFLIENPVSDLTKQVTLNSKRLRGHEFTISAMDGGTFSGYQTQCTTPGRKKQGPTVNTGKLYLLIVLNHTVEPNFKDAAFLKALKCDTPEMAIQKTLLAGEIQDLAEAIMDLSGFDTLEDDMEFVGNDLRTETETSGTASTL